MAARRLALLLLTALLLALGSALGYGITQQGWQSAPKLALDLEGGTQVILQAKPRSGSSVSNEQMEQARQIMAQRINALGVAETEISVQGGTNIMVSVPGKIDDATANALRRTATMSFRPVLFQGAPEGASASDGGASDGGAPRSADEFGPVVGAKPATPESAAGASDAGGSDAGGAESSGEPQPWSQDWLASGLEAEFMRVDCTDATVRQNLNVNDRPDVAVVSCAPDGSAKFVLGPEVITGDSIKNATAGPETNTSGQTTGFYVVNLTFDEPAGKLMGQMTNALFGGQGATRQFAIVLDSLVISAPEVQAPTSTSSAISGNFSADQAQELASQLKFGALPLEFSVQSEQQISATLGSDQLEKGLIAGLIGLGLVVLYAVFQYRVLAIVTASSLAIMGLLAYAIITIMSNSPDIGYRLSLAGVAGLIVAIAFTADSFIVYFERVRDEIRDGRGIQAAVDHGWNRAKRTILASDAVNVVAAVVLYLVSAGSVRGFAFTLGLTTVLDILVVFLFTHPVLQSLTRTNFFGKGHPLSGLDPAGLGRNLPAYAGRARFRSPEERALTGRSSRKKNVENTYETLAERKAREAREAQERAQEEEQA